MSEPQVVRGSYLSPLVRLVLLVVAVVVFVVAALLAFGWVDKHSAAAINDAIGWAAIGLALFAAAHL